MNGIEELDAFPFCYGLTEVKLPSTVKKLGTYCFKECINLEKVNIENIEEVGMTTFSNTPFINSFKDEFVVLCGFLYKYNGNKKTLKIDDFPQDLKYIASDFIKSIEEIEYIELPYLTENKYGSFHRFYSNNLKTVIISEGYTLFERGKFWNLKGLETVVVPSTITRFSEDFYGCDNLTAVYYCGTDEKWEQIIVSDFTKKIDDKVYFCSEEKPIKEGKYWHYVDGNITIWE